MLNIFSLLAVFLPITAAFIWRMHVEEAALHQAFGRAYVTYAARTSRILPPIW